MAFECFWLYKSIFATQNACRVEREHNTLSYYDKECRHVLRVHYAHYSFQKACIMLGLCVVSGAGFARHAQLTHN